MKKMSEIPALYLSRGRADTSIMPQNDSNPDAQRLQHNSPGLAAPVGDFDELQASSPWDPGSPASSDAHPTDPYSPDMIGRVSGVEDHNSSSITPVETVYHGMGSDS